MVRTDKPPPTSYLHQNGVYHIPISLPDGTSTAYIGSTIRSLEQRILEHQRSCRDRNFYSALAHSTMSGGMPLWSEASILGQARTTTLLRWKEALFIHLHHTINQPSLLLNPTLIQATGLGTNTQPPDLPPVNTSRSTGTSNLLLQLSWLTDFSVYSRPTVNIPLWLTEEEACASFETDV